MRTRFLATDYFSAMSTCEALRHFEVPSLPVPSFYSPDSSYGVEIPFFVPDPSVLHEIDRFPYEEALSDFLSDVLPQLLSVGERDPSDGTTGMQFAPSYAIEHGEIRSATAKTEDRKREDGSLCNEMEVEESLVFHSGASAAKLSESFFEFEIAEVEEFQMLTVGVSSKGIVATLFFEIPGASIPLDKVDIDMIISIASPYEVDRLLCLIEDIPDILIINQEDITIKANNSLQDKKFFHATESPSFELGEISLGLHESYCMDETLNDLLAYLKPQNNGDELVVNAKDFLGSPDANVTENFLTQDLPEYCLEHKLLCLNSLLELDPINFNGSILFEEQSVIYQVPSDDSSPHYPCSTQLEEVQIFDNAFINVPDMFNIFETVKKYDFFEQMCKEEMGHAANFYETVLISELSLMDDTYKIMPAPFLSDEKALKSGSMVVEDIFNDLKPHHFSVCDEIYLDWHPLLEGFCNNETCSTFISMAHEVGSYLIDTSDLNSQYEKFMHSEFDFMNDSSGEVSILQCKEELNDVLGKCPDTLGPTIETDVTEIVNHKLKESDGTEQIPKGAPAKISSLVESLSYTDDLNFFLGVRKGNADVSGFGTYSANRPSSQTTSRNNLKEPSELASFSEPEYQNIKVHKASLPNYTLDLIDQIQGIYFSNLNKCKHLICNSSLPTIKDYELLSISKVRMLELIAENCGSLYSLGIRDEAFVALLVIYAVKQLVYYLCFFGFHIAYLYLSNCSRKVDNLEAKLQPLQSLLQDAHLKIEKQLIESHPSLSLIEDLLRSNASQGYQKSLIISDEVFWPSLKHKLTILKIPFQEVSHPYCSAENMDILGSNRSVNSISEAILGSDCLLITYENISASFPFNMFINILEYGGSRATPRLSDVFPCSGGFPHVHFIRLDIENHHFAKALCEDFDASKDHMISTEGFPRDMLHLLGYLNDDNTEGLLCKFPPDNTCFNSHESIRTIEACHGKEYANNSLQLSSSNKSSSTASVPEVVIIVNTQNLEKNMIMSRRSSYQKILALENRGIQVVERDINLPLDLIFSAAVCLVWYEARNTADKAEAIVDISAVPAFIENIATKVLMSLSSSFSGCILIFEGESNFLASIMEASDMLYAAAASLDLNLQLFCSHMPETTDDIILNCIRTTSIIDRDLCSPMPESESIAEHFLTRFPSLNPLSAHAIISSSGMLVEFLEWSHELRIQSIGKYKVPAESISLFNALCRYGELAESKSVMTDCSSIDSDNSGGALQSTRKPQRYGMSSRGPSQLKTQAFSNEEITYRKHDVNHLERNNLREDKRAKNSHPQVEFCNDFIDYNTSFLDEASASIPRSAFNLMRSDLRYKPSIESFLSPGRSTDNHSRTFPSAAEINFAENDSRDSSKRNRLEKETCGLKEGFLNKEMFTKNYELSHENHSDALKYASTVPSLGEFLRSNATRFSDQDGRRHVIKSLGEANERSSLHPQSLCNSYLSCPRSLKRKAAYQKRSPSVIDSFKYCGGSKPAKGTVNKGKNLSRARSSSRDLDNKDSPLITPTWTPIDKRARQLLSFARTGNTQQSRLVWRRSDSPRINCSLRKRQRNDV